MWSRTVTLCEGTEQERAEAIRASNLVMVALLRLGEAWISVADSLHPRQTKGSVMQITLPKLLPPQPRSDSPRLYMSACRITIEGCGLKPFGG
jgi:hypothetical protein